MTTRAPELDEFLAVVGQVLGGHAADAGPGALDAALADADILALGLETAELDDALLWVTEVVVTAARVDASVGYALAGRYAAQRALLDHALDTPGDPGAHLALAATAGRAAVDIAVDAIQVLGGYGCIEEYPVAGLLRDALSLRARGLPRRSGLAGMADVRLGAGA